MADGPVYGFDHGGVERIVRTVRDHEAAPFRARKVLETQLPNWQHVRITGPAVDTTESDSDDSDADSDAYASGLIFYTGIVVAWDASANADAEYGDVWVLGRSGVGFDEGDVCACRQSGDLTLNAESRPLFVTTQGGGAFEEITFIECIEEISDTSSGY